MLKFFSVKFTASNPDVDVNNINDKSDVNTPSDEKQQNNVETESIPESHAGTSSDSLDSKTNDAQNNSEDNLDLQVTAQLVTHNGGLGIHISGFEKANLSSEDIEVVKQIARDKFLKDQLECSKNGEPPPVQVMVSIPLPISPATELPTAGKFFPL
jgi:hypothetical protein